MEKKEQQGHQVSQGSVVHQVRVERRDFRALRGMQGTLAPEETLEQQEPREIEEVMDTTTQDPEGTREGEETLVYLDCRAPEVIMERKEPRELQEQKDRQGSQGKRVFLGTEE